MYEYTIHRYMMDHLISFPKSVTFSDSLIQAFDVGGAAVVAQ